MSLVPVLVEPLRLQCLYNAKTSDTTLKYELENETALKRLINSALFIMMIELAPFIYSFDYLYFFLIF